MEIKRNLSLVLFALVFLLPACSKKENVCKLDENKKVAMAESDMLLASSIPTVNEEIEDFFEEDSISEFAMVDDDFADNEELEDLFAAEKQDESVTVAKSEDFSEDEANALTWREEDEAEEEAASFKTVYFDINKNSIRDDQKESLNKNIETARSAAEQGKNIVIQGHCCQLGSPSYNVSLSERRANAIRKEMVRNGIPENNIKTVGCGQEMPTVWSDNPDKSEKISELAPNRRSEILIS